MDESRNFGKVGGKGAKPRTGGGLPQKILKIRCDFLQSGIYFGIRMALDIIQNWAFAEQKQ